MRAKTPLLLALGLALGGSQVPAAGFDCAKAKSWVEKTICADAALSKLDDELTAKYRAALRKTTDAGALRASQRSWLKQRRDACQTGACLADVYRDRRRQLEQIVAGRVAASNIEGTYTRWLQGKPDPSSAEIRLRPLGGGEVFATGDASWVDNASGIARTGSFAGTAAINGGKIVYSDGNTDGCRMTIRVNENALSVDDDNGQCGGLNVTFDGEYRKAPG